MIKIGDLRYSRALGNSNFLLQISIKYYAEFQLIRNVAIKTRYTELVFRVTCRGGQI